MTRDEFLDLLARLRRASVGNLRAPHKPLLLLWLFGRFAVTGVTLAAASGTQSREASPLRDALADLMSAAGLVRRVGTNLNQAVARLNATGQRGEDLLPAAEFCAQVVRRLDEAAEQVRRSIP